MGRKNAEKSNTDTSTQTSMLSLRELARRTRRSQQILQLLIVVVMDYTVLMQSVLLQTPGGLYYGATTVELDELSIQTAASFNC